MKVSKKGKVIVTGADRRVGNFVWSNYAETIAFSDINRTIQTKVNKRALVGQMLENAIKQKNDTFLHNYAAMIYYLNGVVPDQQFMTEVIKAAEACLKRHPELYGMKEVSDEEDARIVQEEKELKEFEEEVRNLPEEEGDAG